MGNLAKLRDKLKLKFTGMNIYIILTLIGLVSLTESACTTPSLRKEIRELTDDEYNKYVRAALALNKRSTPTTRSIWENFTKLHYDGANLNRKIHGTPAFLPWHRKFIKMYELELQKIEPTVNLPYWDWSQDADQPHLSPVLTPLYIGGNGNRLNNQILDNGPFNNTKLIYSNKHTLSRDYDQGDAISPFASTTDIGFILANSMFSKMCNQLEGVHGAPHVFIGNWEDFGMYTSPNDPIFYLHHAFIDMIWAKWQDKNPNANQYEGTDYRLSVKPTDTLYGYTDKVSSTLNYTANAYCYNYPAYPRPLTPNRTNPLLRRATNVNGIIDDTALNSVVSGLTLEQAVTKLETLDVQFTPLINQIDADKKLNDTYAQPNSDTETVPKRTPLPDRWIQSNNLDASKVRDFESKQLKVRKLFKRLKPVKNKIHGRR